MTQSAIAVVTHSHHAHNSTLTARNHCYDHTCSSKPARTYAGITSNVLLSFFTYMIQINRPEQTQKLTMELSFNDTYFEMTWSFVQLARRFWIWPQSCIETSNLRSFERFGVLVGVQRIQCQRGALRSTWSVKCQRVCFHVDTAEQNT